VTDHVASVLCTGLVFPEGPRWRGDRLWFSDIRDGAVKTVTPDGTVERQVEVSHPSGLGWLPDGRLLVIGMEDRVLWRVEADGSLVVHADLTELARAACNDMVVDADGNAYLGAYDIAIGQGVSDPDQGKLVLVRPDGRAEVAAGRLRFPNGMVITPDGATLILAESGGRRLVGFDRHADGTLGSPRTWAELTYPPDGICLDADGGVWVANPIGDGASRVLEGGEITDQVTTGSPTLAVALGGADRTTLHLATASSPRFEEAQANPAGRIDVAPVAVPAAGWP
jgi:sugar lactone lactonase YvrE